MCWSEQVRLTLARSCKPPARVTRGEAVRRLLLVSRKKWRALICQNLYSAPPSTPVLLLVAVVLIPLDPPLHGNIATYTNFETGLDLTALVPESGTPSSTGISSHSPFDPSLFLFPPLLPIPSPYIAILSSLEFSPPPTLLFDATLNLLRSYCAQGVKYLYGKAQTYAHTILRIQFKRKKQT